MFKYLNLSLLLILQNLLYANSTLLNVVYLNKLNIVDFVENMDNYKVVDCFSKPLYEQNYK